MRNIKKILKDIYLLYLINYIIKSKWDEKKARNELNFYRRQAIIKGIKIPNQNRLKEMLMQRLKKRGIILKKKSKGKLHIFFVYPLANWESILAKELKRFGKVTEFEYHSKGFNEKSRDWLKERDLMNKKMLESFYQADKERKIDAVFGYLSGHNTNPKVLQEMAKHTIVFNMCLDDKLLFRDTLFGGRWKGVASIASSVDLNLSNAPESLIKYFVEGGLALFWPEAASPEVHKQGKGLFDERFKYNVSFVGQKYGYRGVLVHNLMKKWIKVFTCGKGWPNEKISIENLARIYSQSRINLGFAGVGMSKNLMCLKARDFEVPMCRGLYLTQDNPELKLVYNLGKEILTYNDENDCIRKIKWILKNPKIAEKIRQAGYRRILKDHTWQKRFTDLFKFVGLLR